MSCGIGFGQSLIKGHASGSHFFSRGLFCLSQMLYSEECKMQNRETPMDHSVFLV